MDLSTEQPVGGEGGSMAGVGSGNGRKPQPYPDNGFSDADGRLTALARLRLEEFFAAYPVPAKALYAPSVYRKYPGVCHWVMGLFRSGDMARTDIGDELDADIRMSVTAGIRRFDPAAGSSLTTYLIRWVVSGAQKTLERIRRGQRITIVSVLDGDDDDRFGVPHDSAFAGGEPDDVEPLGVFQEAMGRIDPAVAELVRRRVLNGERFKDMAAEAGVSKESVRRRVQRGVRRLAEMAGLDC